MGSHVVGGEQQRVQGIARSHCNHHFLQRDLSGAAEAEAAARFSTSHIC